MRTIRLFNKGIGKGQKLAWVPTVSPLLENDQGNDPLGWACRMSERGTTGTSNRQQTFLKAGGLR